MDVDAATLAHMMTDVGRAAVDALKGQHTQDVFRLPPWLAEDRWKGVYSTMRTLIERFVLLTVFVALCFSMYRGDICEHGFLYRIGNGNVVCCYKYFLSNNSLGAT